MIAQESFGRRVGGSLLSKSRCGRLNVLGGDEVDAHAGVLMIVVMFIMLFGMSSDGVANLFGPLAVDDSGKLTRNDYLFSSELSLQGRGNYWGLSSADGGFDRSKV